MSSKNNLAHGDIHECANYHYCLEISPLALRQEILEPVTAKKLSNPTKSEEFCKSS